VVVTGSTRNRLVPLRAGHVGSNPTLSASILFRFPQMPCGNERGKQGPLSNPRIAAGHTPHLAKGGGQLPFTLCDAERCPSWPKERDWKSRVLLTSGTEGSNPSLSATIGVTMIHPRVL
jgi:hypothetical protein